MSKLIVNLKTGAVTSIPNNTVGLLLETGYIDLGNYARPTDAYFYRNDNSEFKFTITPLHRQSVQYTTTAIKINLGKGIKARFMKFGISTISQDIESIKINLIPSKRNV